MIGEEFICCLCGKKVTGSFGNNPWPLSNDINERCCDACNMTKIIPARLGIIQANRENKEKK